MKPRTYTQPWDPAWWQKRLDLIEVEYGWVHYIQWRRGAHKRLNSDDLAWISGAV